ncbi:MAG: UDP-N-acetylglucosamine/UDP-N-acetylgalactosamine diphosphorylase [Pirellulaceae bacterium]|jgi:UDP-N-acetylglucosamine/UDP-N-acetylgalactosamine diphosphorylase
MNEAILKASVDHLASETHEELYPVLLAKLRQHNQKHLIGFWDELNPDQRQTLADQIDGLDLELVARLMRNKSTEQDWGAVAARVLPPPAVRLNHENEKRSELARTIGAAVLTAGTVGVVIVAGGQGTRLGFAKPKGMYPIGPLSDATLFQILTEKVLALRNKYNVDIPLYIMTSPATHAETVEFFEKNDNFGLPASELFVFCQGVMPAVDENGRLMLSAKDQLCLNPDGHGGMLAALKKSGAVDDLKTRGIEHLLYVQVDNALVELGNPEFLGYHVLTSSDITTAAIAKHAPDDRVGNIVTLDEKLQIIEYSDIPDTLAERRTENGDLDLWAGNTAVHCMTVAFLEQVADGTINLPFHYAHKKVPHLNKNGAWVEPTAPNATKFERFIFDLLPAARRSFVVEVDSSLTYGPLKNASGAEEHSPEAVHVQMMDVHRQWLRAAGVEIGDEVKIEISPLWANTAADVRHKIVSGTKITRDTYLQ